MKTIARLFLFISLAGSASILYAQHEMVDTAVFQKIRIAELNSSQIPQIAHYLTDVSGSRLTNSPGFKRAGTWAIESMKKWGLQNAAFEPWGEYGRGWDVEEFNISLRAPYTGYIIGYPLPWSSNTNGEIRAPVFEILDSQLTDSVWMEKHRDEIRGKIIFLTSVRAPNTKKILNRFPQGLPTVNSCVFQIPMSILISRLHFLYPL